MAGKQRDKNSRQLHFGFTGARYDSAMANYALGVDSPKAYVMGKCGIITAVVSSS